MNSLLVTFLAFKYQVKNIHMTMILGFFFTLNDVFSKLSHVYEFLVIRPKSIGKLINIYEIIMFSILYQEIW